MKQPLLFISQHINIISLSKTPYTIHYTTCLPLFNGTGRKRIPEKNFNDIVCGAFLDGKQHHRGHYVWVCFYRIESKAG